MTSFFKKLGELVGGAIGLLIGGALVIVICFGIFNLFGLLFGFEYRAEVCRDFRLHSQANWAYYGFPIAPYACKKDAGLLQPATSNFFTWLGEEHK